MKVADFTQPGGLPFDQDTLDFMQQSWYELVNAFLAHFMLNDSDNYIISGCEASGASITSGWMIINGELLYFEGGSGSATSKIAVNTENTPLTFQDGTNHEVYKYKKAVISTTGPALSTFIRIPNANEFLTSLPNATESQRGIAEIATQTEANTNTEDTRILTAKKLYNRTATESRRGVAEIATQAETNAGTDDTRIVTPKKVVQAISDLAPQPPQATESVKGIAEIATQTEANTTTDDSRIITAKKLNARTATTSRRGVVELATTAEVTTGTDSTRAVTPSSLKNAGIKPLRVTRGTVMTSNRAGGYNQNNYTVNRAYVYPPSGYSMSHLRGFIASIAEIHLAGDVDGNDSFWCKYQIQSTRVVVIAQNSENRANSRINYLAIWQK